MSRKVNARRIRPGDVRLEWDGLDPVLVLTELSGPTETRVSVEVPYWMTTTLVRLLGDVAKRYAEEAAAIRNTMLERGAP